MSNELDFLALPWHAEGYHIYDNDGSHVGLAEPAKVSCGGTADFIARACSAFPHMLAALEAVQQGFQDGSIKFAKRRQSDSDPYHPANVLICAAMEQATSLERATGEV